jgi:hypothetical protein
MKQPAKFALSHRCSGGRAGGQAGRQRATGQQIAQEFFITVSTVEQHLTRIYR